jgi:hypothetical protein
LLGGTSASTENENSNLALRSIIAAAITGWFGTVLFKF